ncbi:hypothetical protein [Amycolatopsis sp. cg9]|uniref:hypothetical protein n=1 Tax=Amycolatopsis sp. cg9 TaxID=3238801 RepID=UPI0035250514
MTEVGAERADWAYRTILARLLEFTSTLGDRSAPAVCAVVRQSPMRLLAGLMPDQDPDRRYGIELPLFRTDGTAVPWNRAIDAIREVHRHRDEYLADDRADHRFHGAPVRFVGGTPADLENEVFGLAGFSCHELTALRLYLRYHREGVVLGIDVPVPPRDGTAGAGGAFTMIELSALFRGGVPANIAERERAADRYCDRSYDLRPWFGRN